MNAPKNKKTVHERFTSLHPVKGIIYKIAEKITRFLPGMNIALLSKNQT